MTEPSLKALEESANAGDSQALHELYFAYARGDRGATRDTEKAMAFLHRAAELGNSVSQRFLAREIYSEDRAASLRWALEAAKKRDVEGMLHAAGMLVAGRGVPADVKKALSLYKKAAYLGNDEGQKAYASERKRLAAQKRSGRKNLARAMDDVGLTRYREQFLALAAPSIRLVTTAKADAKIRRGATKIGGAPDLPPKTPWPRTKGRPLSFLAQLDLRALAADTLPGKGLLSFFYDAKEMPWGSPGEEEQWRVILSPRTGLVRRRPPPKARSFPPCIVDTFPELTIPPARSALRRSLPDPASEKYGELEAKLRADYTRRPLDDGDVHRVLGHPDAIQGDMTRRIEYALAGVDLEQPREDLDERARTWRLLLQIDSDDRAGMMWYNLGRLYFWIREEDLAARHFERVMLQLQTS